MQHEWSRGRNYSFEPGAVVSTASPAPRSSLISASEYSNSLRTSMVCCPGAGSFEGARAGVRDRRGAAADSNISGFIALRTKVLRPWLCLSWIASSMSKIGKAHASLPLNIAAYTCYNTIRLVASRFYGFVDTV